MPGHVPVKVIGWLRRLHMLERTLQSQILIETAISLWCCTANRRKTESSMLTKCCCGTDQARDRRVMWIIKL